MATKKICIAKEFNLSPFDKYKMDGGGRGEEFRETFLVPALEVYENVIVDLSGYCRYGLSFIDEAFGGLVRNHNFSPDCLKRRLTIVHNELPSFVCMAWLCIEDIDNLRRH